MTRLTFLISLLSPLAFWRKKRRRRKRRYHYGRPGYKIIASFDTYEELFAFAIKQHGKDFYRMNRTFHTSKPNP